HVAVTQHPLLERVGAHDELLEPVDYRLRLSVGGDERENDDRGLDGPEALDGFEVPIEKVNGEVDRLVPEEEPQDQGDADQDHEVAQPHHGELDLAVELFPPFLPELLLYPPDDT